jgi:hypothetical protein
LGGLLHRCELRENASHRLHNPGDCVHRTVATPQTVSVRDADAAPETVLNRTLLLTGVMSVLKQDTTLLSSSGDTSLDAYVTFADGWRTRSPAKAVRLLDQLRRRSKTRWPHRGYTVIELDFKSADVVLEGRLTNNLDFKPMSARGGSETRLLKFIDRRFTAKYRFEITRIVRLKEHHWSTKPPNKSLDRSGGGVFRNLNDPAGVE